MRTERLLPAVFVVLAAVYLVYDAYRSSNGAQMLFAGVALVWSLFTLFTFVVH